jgi:hypothetical protein
VEASRLGLKLSQSAHFPFRFWAALLRSVCPMLKSVARYNLRSSPKRDIRSNGADEP